ncbi:MAG: hypothetical protein QNK19_13585 [Xanthomonadales bacterium]|nr:hypothetical protein [Xanthomonadales bacterium]
MILLISPVLAEEERETPLLGPLNSDPLTERGISPRVLDIALFPLSQGIAFEMMMSYQVNGERGESHERFRMIYDPNTDYGRDLYIEFETEPLRSVKEYRRSLEVTMGSDYWVRQQARLYDPKSIKVIESKDGKEVISFRFDKTHVPTKQRWLLYLEGQLHIENGELRRIDFVADRTIERDGVRNQNYRASVVFGAVPEYGGYVIDQMEEQFSFKFKGGSQHIHTHARVIKYTHKTMGEIVWNRMPTELIVETAEIPEDDATLASLNKFPPEPVTRAELEREFETAATVKLDLHRTLPLWADEVRQMGFELPKTYGVGVIGMIQNADFEISDISIGGISAVEDIPFIERYGNNADSNIKTVQVRADFWVLPFLNVSVLGGNLKTDTDVTLHFTPLFRALYEQRTGDELPEFVQGPASTTGSTLGVGLTTGFKYENMVMSASLTYAKTVTNETSFKIDALVFVGMVGYDVGDMGMQIMTGIQYLDTDTTIVGQLDLGEGKDPLDFSLGLEIEEVVFMVGVNKDIGRNWTLSGFLGFNETRTQGTLMFGYRW